LCKDLLYVLTAIILLILSANTNQGGRLCWLESPWLYWSSWKCFARSVDWVQHPPVYGQLRGSTACHASDSWTFHECWYHLGLLETLTRYLQGFLSSNCWWNAHNRA